MSQLPQPIELTPPLFIDMTQQLLIQLYEVLRQETDKGVVSNECVKSVRQVITNLRILSPYIVRKLAERFPQPPSQHAPAAKTQPVAASAGTQT
jgi:hypothetical protein